MNIEASWLDIVPGIGPIRASGRLNRQAELLLKKHREVNDEVDRLITQMKELSALATACLDLSQQLLDGDRATSSTLRAPVEDR